MWWAYRDRAPHVCRPFNPVPRNPVASWSSLSWKWVSFKFSNQSLEWKKCLKNDNLIEVVMDLGRKPLTRFPYGDWVISQEPVMREDLQHAISKVGDFSDENRSGIDRSLHRISAIRNRKMQIIGLTCWVHRAVSGSAEIIRDLVEDGGSILVIGPPGVGKTTMMREIARMLVDEHNKRILIVDTSNEIGGDGDVPHSGIGRARRMQVPKVSMQHDSVTLGDEEARSRRVQKTVLERKGPPTFAYAVEIISRTEFHVHHRLDATVDAILAGRSPLFEIRHMDPEAKGSEKHSATPGKKQTQVYEFRHASEFIKHDNRRAETESEDEDTDADADVDIPHHTKR